MSLIWSLFLFSLKIFSTPQGSVRKVWILSLPFTMISSLRQPVVGISGSDLLLRQRHATPVKARSFLPSLARKKGQGSLVSVHKPLHIASSLGGRNFVSVKSNGKGDSVKCEAYEADRSEVESSNTPSEASKKVKIGIYFATWWALNVVFNIYNKKVLNAYPFPWLTSTLSLACGSLMMLISWATGIAEAPKTDPEFWKSLFPVSIELVLFVCFLWMEGSDGFVLFALVFFVLAKNVFHFDNFGHISGCLCWLTPETYKVEKTEYVPIKPCGSIGLN